MSNNGQNNGITMVFAFFTGFMAGAVVSLLYAPSTGKETRQKIRDTSIDAKNRTVELAQQAADGARQAADDARQGAQTLVEQGKESVHDIVDTSKERLHEAGEQVKTAVEAGRKVSADVRSKIAESIPGVGGNGSEEASKKV